MSYDLYVDCPEKGDEATQVRLLVAKDMQNVTEKYLRLVHRIDGKMPGKPSAPNQYDNLISNELKRLRALGMLSPDPDLFLPGSWFLRFDFELLRPWISKDDDPFYVAASVNPVRKDKVFRAPVMSAAGWKGLLRWTLMHIKLALKKDALNPKYFAERRFLQTQLFGDEQGEEAGQAQGFAAYLDALKPEARAAYERLVRTIFASHPAHEQDPLPHHAGRLVFYPTFFDRIDVEVINPHSRTTKSGTQPIYLECVPAGAKGTFSLLYFPFDLVNQTRDSVVDEARRHLLYLVPAIKALFRKYGFSAKRTSGFGMAKDEITGIIKTPAEEKTLTCLSKLLEEVRNVRW